MNSFLCQKRLNMPEVTKFFKNCLIFVLRHPGKISYSGLVCRPLSSDNELGDVSYGIFVRV